MCRDTDSKEINETGLYRSEKSWKAILLRELKEIGVIQLNKENAENAQVKQTRVGVFQACGTETRVTTSSPTKVDSRAWLTPLSSYATNKKNTLPPSFLLEEAV